MRGWSEGQATVAILKTFRGTRLSPDQPCDRVVPHPHEPHFWWEGGVAMKWCYGE